MAVYLRSASLKGSPFIFDILHVTPNIIYGAFRSKTVLDKIPALFEADYHVDGFGVRSKIHPDTLRWFHYEDRYSLMIYNHFHLPHYVRAGDTLLYLE
jgi:hypothetical protein